MEGKRMLKINFPYRASSHLVLLHVIHESGSWAKHGLDVNYNFNISKKDAHHKVPAGEIEFVGGNHVSTYGARARGDTWCYIGQTINVVAKKLVCRPDSGINGLTDLYGKKIGTRGSHPTLDDWLYLKQRGLDAERDEVELVRTRDLDAEGNEIKRTALWQWVRDGRVDAALLTPPGHLFAEVAGLRVIDIEPMPMIWFTTLSTSLQLVERHPDVVQRFLKGIIEGVHFFKTEPEKSIRIIKDRYTKEGQLTDAQARMTYEIMAPALEPRLYPSMAAIANVYEEAKKQDPDARKINPLALWNLQHARHLDDIGFVDSLYGRNDAPKAIKDPDELAEMQARNADLVSEIKACGHLHSISCDCE
jgi:ABC-type nitrate/sulfonate/bicarbonate transport system substrate-binding protein